MSYANEFVLESLKSFNRDRSKFGGSAMSIEPSAPEEHEVEDSGRFFDDLSADFFDVDSFRSSFRQNRPPVSSEQNTADRDLVEQLLDEITKLQGKVERLTTENEKVRELTAKVSDLETQVATKESEVLQAKQLNQDLIRHTEEASRYQEYEKRAKVMEEKFEKLNDLYTKLREEHLQLIRAKAEVDQKLIMALQQSKESGETNVDVENKKWFCFF